MWSVVVSVSIVNDTLRKDNNVVSGASILGVLSVINDSDRPSFFFNLCGRPFFYKYMSPKILFVLCSTLFECLWTFRFYLCFHRLVDVGWGVVGAVRFVWSKDSV